MSYQVHVYERCWFKAEPVVAFPEKNTPYSMSYTTKMGESTSQRNPQCPTAVKLFYRKRDACASQLYRKCRMHPRQYTYEQQSGILMSFKNNNAKTLGGKKKKKKKKKTATNIAVVPSHT